MTETDHPLILLASQSPRRQELIALGGWRFRVLPAEVDERTRPNETPSAYVLRLAAAKARAVLPLARRERIVVGADTAVVDAGEILGKPMDRTEAVAMLQRLRGRSHRVYTALAVLRVADGEVYTDVCVSEVPMRRYTEDEIRTYVDSGDPLDKAGAYAIQHTGFSPVESLRGCFANVMGLPVCHLVRTLRQLAIQPRADVPQACQSHLAYCCPVYESILRDGDGLATHREMIE